MLGIANIRAHFPSLTGEAVFLDNPAGTQIVQEALQRIQHYFLHTNANSGGAFRTSQESDAIIAETRQAVADFLNAGDPNEIIFGPNMTTLTLHISRSLARLLKPGDELVVTRLDHDANIAPWLLIAQDQGCQVRWVDIHPEDCTLNMEEMERQITERTKIVAVGYASNGVGTINDVKRAVQLAHQVGALCFVDAVQYAPHRPIDVQDLDCDFLVCSAYKFFGPHIGILYGKYDLLNQLTPYKVRPAPDQVPESFETGTKSFETIAGVLGVMDYLAWVGTTHGADFAHRYQSRFEGRKLALKLGMEALSEHEQYLSKLLLEGLSSIPGLHLRGITNMQRLHERVPTYAFTIDGWSPRAVAEHLGKQQIYVWDGNYYALELMQRLGLEEHGGMVRVGPVHYNTPAEIQRIVEALQTLVH
jgi:cysteine desulfurase family protein (TIGR01976 family)